MAVETPSISLVAVFIEVVTTVQQRLAQDWAIERAELKPLPTPSATFCNGVPTALKRSEKTPLFSFAIIDVCFCDKGSCACKKSVYSESSVETHE